MKLLLEVPGISLNRRDEDGKTPLYKAVEIRSNNAVKMLLQKGANLLMKARDRRNAFEYALQELGDNSIQMIKYLYNDCGMKDLRKERGKMTFVHLACLARRNIPVTKTLDMLLARENINATEGMGRTALMLATQTNRPDIVQLLLHHHADVMHLDMRLTTAKGYAEPDSEIYKMLDNAMLKVSRKKARAREMEKEVSEQLKKQQQKYKTSTKTVKTATG
ncbi:ankyrin repeat domain-containing protein 36B-like isoform X2 [Hydractinia symbiolongicarpus]|nr:ankyrin repeat domain-containing protein 36B-like isoform X2 [Hydractinia symbiolongicarpus]